MNRFPQFLNTTTQHLTPTISDNGKESTPKQSMKNQEPQLILISIQTNFCMNLRYFKKFSYLCLTQIYVVLLIQFSFVALGCAVKELIVRND